MKDEKTNSKKEHILGWPVPGVIEVNPVTAGPLPKHLTGTPIQAVKERAKSLDEIYDRLNRDIKILDAFNDPSKAAYPPEKIAEALSDRFRDMRDKGEILLMPEPPSTKETNLRVWLDWLQKMILENKPGASGNELKKWADLSLVVIDENTVKYKISDGKWITASNRELGFADKRTKGKRIRRIWNVFLLLVKHYEQTATFEPGIQKNVERVGNVFQEYFGLKDSSPVYYSKTYVRYKFNFNVKDERV